MGLDPNVLACFNRDGWKCRHCQSRNGLHSHHIEYRSHQGSDELSNRITLCACCHMDGIHRGRLEIQVVSQAGDMLEVRFIRKKGWAPK